MDNLLVELFNLNKEKRETRKAFYPNPRKKSEQKFLKALFALWVPLSM